MQHRHLSLTPSQQWCLPAIDDIIVRGNLGDWLDLLEAAEVDSQQEIIPKIERLCAANADPYEQSYRFFVNYFSCVDAAALVPKTIDVVGWPNRLTSVLSSGTGMKDQDWEALLSAASMLQQLLPDAVLVGGTAAAIHAQHRISNDANHVLVDLRERFEAVLGELESVSGWQTARVRRPVLILGNLDGIETGVRQLIRSRPLETESITVKGQSIVIPTIAEMLRIKSVLALKRNATRDYIDVAALSGVMGMDASVSALVPMDDYYPQPQPGAVRQQLLRQFAEPLPYDLEETDLSSYKRLEQQWQDWNRVKHQCMKLSQSLARALVQQKRSRRV